MPVPLITVRVKAPGVAALSLETILSQETNAMLSSIIEDPTGTNNFSTGDITFKGYDRPGGTMVSDYLAGMTPTSNNYLVTVYSAIVPPGGGNPVGDVYFQGYLAPNTLQFEKRTGAFSFTVIGLARLLQTTDASPLFQRPGYPTFPSTGYVAGYDSKWYLYSSPSPLDTQNPFLQVACATPQSYPDFVAGDQIQVGVGDKFTVVSVAAGTGTPPAYWKLGTKEVASQAYAAGSASPVHLLTPYQRNLSLESMVTTLFAAAGFNTKKYFGSAALPLGGLFAAPVSPAGLPQGVLFGGGIAAAVESSGVLIVVSGPGGTYSASNPTSGWSLINSGAGFRQPPQDATNYQTGTTMLGPDRDYTRTSDPQFGLTSTMNFYAYDRHSNNTRYILTVTCDANVAPGSPNSITTALNVEVCTPGVWVWGGTTPIAGFGINTTSSTNLANLYNAIGIDVDPATGTVFFTDIQLSGAAGSPVTMNTSSYQPSGAGYVANRATGVNGPIVMTAPSRCVVFQTDGFLGKPAKSFMYTLAANGAMTPIISNTIDPYIVGTSLKKNAGDGRYYGLISNPNTGVWIVSWPTDNLTPDSLTKPIQIGTAPAGGTQIAKTGSRDTGMTTIWQKQGYTVDLAVQYGVSNGPGAACPMFALIGGSVLFISNKGSGYVPYADMTGLAVSDALQQLSVLNAGIFYVDSFLRWVFRSRSAPMPGDTIGTNDQIDGDAGLLSLTVQPVYNLWTGYVSVQNSNDDTIFGDTSNVSGSIAYANTSKPGSVQGFCLQLSSSFVDSSAFAKALANSLYNYLGAQKRWIQIERFRDGRTYEVGRTFHCHVDGSNRNFQILEVDIPITGVTVKVVGLEV